MNYRHEKKLYTSFSVSNLQLGEDNTGPKVLCAKHSDSVDTSDRGCIRWDWRGIRGAFRKAAHLFIHLTFSSTICSKHHSTCWRSVVNKIDMLCFVMEFIS